MPLYEYECEACGQRFEVIRKFSESELDACTLCGKGPVRRLMSSPAIQFKGTGWYVTDYSSKGKAPTESSTASKNDAKKADAGSSDASAAKSDTSAAKTDGGGTSTPTKSSSET